MPPASFTLCDDVRDARSPVVVAARRTPVGTAGRSLAAYDVTALSVPVLRALVSDLASDPADAAGHVPVDEVVLGNCMGPGGDPARVAALAAGLGLNVPGVTLDRQCGSGLEAIAQAATHVAVAGGVVLAGGVESASTAPTRLALLPDGRREPYDRARFAPDEYGDPGMGEAADALATARGITRERQDAYAARSHALAVAAQATGVFEPELVAVGAVKADERPRPGLDGARLARFRPAFTPDGTATAGNSCGISDGAAAVAVVDEATRAHLGLPGLAVRAVAAIGVDPRLPGLGPVPAVQAVLDVCGLSIADVGALEITEAFAAQVLASTDAWGLDPLGGPGEQVVCTQGGAIALGHPWGASGALLVVRLFSRMVRQDGPRYGVATCAVGGGQGVALLVERVG
ncbi:thiolase family protein [Angustibacter sp. Root456]|uniref:thiolase family protein n=1 Tax=Angustibacter sp. Root456 TaxID=1736539 RepID=UPI0007004457|nr:thiolase family protein [Angustibacter sp. Root456]KQX66597.1 acetyl-CoA acetyltransferase [Angustibacter sp. Root456]